MFAAAAKVLLYAPSHRQDVTPVVEHWLEREVPMYGCTPYFFKSSIRLQNTSLRNMEFLLRDKVHSRHNTEVERSLMVRWVVGSILHEVDPLSYFSFQPVLHDWCNKGRGMCYPVCGIVLIKEPLPLIGKSSPCGGSGFPLSLSERSFTICLTPCNRK